MSLSCDCGYDNYEWQYSAQPFAPLATINRRRCKSCHKMINIGTECLKFYRNREPRYDIEEAIYGDGYSVPLADWYFCESCGELYHILSGLKFYFDIEEDMRELLKEYQRDYAHPSWKAKHFKINQK